MKKLKLSLMFLFLQISFHIFAQKSELQYKELEYTLGNSKIKFLVYESVEPGNTVYINLHDDENTSVEAAKKCLQNNILRGKLIEIQHTGLRAINFVHQGVHYNIDPNRIFSPLGIESNLHYYGSYSKEAALLIEDFGKWIVNHLLKEGKVIVALHNNKNTNSFSVNSYKTGGNYQNDASKYYINAVMGTGDFFYVTQNESFDYLKEKQLNVVLQNEKTVTDDGSLSVYAGMYHIPYINIEAEHSHEKEQIAMIQALQGLLPILSK